MGDFYLAGFESAPTKSDIDIRLKAELSQIDCAIILICDKLESLPLSDNEDEITALLVAILKIAASSRGLNIINLYSRLTQVLKCLMRCMSFVKMS